MKEYDKLAFGNGWPKEKKNRWLRMDLTHFTLYHYRSHWNSNKRQNSLHKIANNHNGNMNIPTTQISREQKFPM